MVVSNETSNTEEQMTDTRKNMDKSHKYQAEQKKSYTKEYIWYDFIDMMPENTERIYSGKISEQGLPLGFGGRIHQEGE